MYLRRRACATPSPFARLPFENDLAADELFQSQRPPRGARLRHLVELRGIGPDAQRRRSPGEVGSGKTTVCRRVAGDLPSRTAPRLLRLADHRPRPRHVQVQSSRRGSSGRPGNSPSSSSTRPSTCATTCSRIFASSPTSAWTPNGACACCSSASPNCAAGCPMAVHESLSQRLVVRHHIGSPRPRRARRLPRPPPAPRRLRTAAVRAARRRGPVPDLPQTATAGQPHRALRPVRRRPRQGANRRRRAHAARPQRTPPLNTRQPASATTALLPLPANAANHPQVRAQCGKSRDRPSGINREARGGSYARDNTPDRGGTIWAINRFVV